MCALKKGKSIPKKTGLNGRDYGGLVKRIGGIFQESREKVLRHINQTQVLAYYEVGREIVEFEQKGSLRADYGEELVKQLSEDLTREFGKGFSMMNLRNMRRLYTEFPIQQTLSVEFNDSPKCKNKKVLKARKAIEKTPITQRFEPLLSWSHYCELLKVRDPLARSFYEQEALQENWSVRQLKRQIGSLLFERLALSKDKGKVLQLAREGQVVERAEDALKDPYILEFLDLREDPSYTESDLEQAIMDRLQYFLLELGKGFCFVARQYRITISNRHYYIDLVFYNSLLKCYVLIDLKTGELSHADVGQMNLYLNYFKKHKMEDCQDVPIGLILSADKDDILAEYVLGGMSNRIFTSKYSLALPSLNQLKSEFRALAARASEICPSKGNPVIELAKIKAVESSDFKMIRPLLEKNGSITTQEVQEILSLSKYRALKVIKNFMAKNFLRQVGSGRAVRYGLASTKNPVE